MLGLVLGGLCVFHIEEYFTWVFFGGGWGGCIFVCRRVGLDVFIGGSCGLEVRGMGFIHMIREVREIMFDYLPTYLK